MASGWWDNSGTISGCVAAYAPVGAADLAASYVNLQNPGTYNAAPVGGSAPSFSAVTGWGHDGTTQYLTTNYSPPNQVAFSLLVRFSGGASSGNHALAACAGIRNLGLFHRLGGLAFCANGNYSQPAAANSGVLGVAGNQGYLDGATHGGTFLAVGEAWPALFIGAYNLGGALYKFSGNIQAVAIYSATLSGAEVATLTTLMNALPVASAKGLPIIAYHHRQVFGG